MAAEGWGRWFRLRNSQAGIGEQIHARTLPPNALSTNSTDILPFPTTTT
jgi:hypothetical protein